VATAGSHEVETPKPKHRARWVWAWPVCHLGDKKNDDKVTQRPPTWSANCRCPDPVVRHQLVKMLRDPSP
jgi:hypothetical protein